MANMIAIVDDDDGVREALEAFLQSLGYQARTFASAEAFLESSNRRAVDCMILDNRMSGLSGLELLKILNSETGAPSVIFMTSYGDEQTRARALAAGASYFLSKPVDLLVLSDCLRSILGC